MSPTQESPRALRVRAGTLARLCTAACRAYPDPLQGDLLGTGDIVGAFSSSGADDRSPDTPPIGTFETRVDSPTAAAGGCHGINPHLILEVAGPQTDVHGGAPARVTVVHVRPAGRLVLLPDEVTPGPRPPGATP